MPVINLLFEDDVWVWSVRDEQVRIPRSCEGSGAVRDGAGL